MSSDDLEFFSKKVFHIHKDLEIFDNIRRKLENRESLDIMFIIDCTGSMQDWIDKCREEINSIIDTIRKKNRLDTQIRISIVGFRDHNDAENFEILPFTENVLEA